MAKKRSVKVRWKFSKRVSILVLFSIIGMGLFTYMISKSYDSNQADIEKDVEKGSSDMDAEPKGEIQELDHEAPVFQESSYNSRMLEKVMSGAIEVLNTDGE